MEKDVKVLIQTEHEGDAAQMDAIFNEYHRILLDVEKRKLWLVRWHTFYHQIYYRLTKKY